MKHCALALVALTVLSVPALAEPVWTGTPIEGGTLTQMRWDPVQADALWARAASAGLFRSTDSGLTWERRTGGMSRPPSRFVVADDGTLFGGAYSTGVTRILRSTDSGASWTEILGPGLQGFNDIAVPPADTNVILFTAFDGLWRSANGGTSWMQITAGVPDNPRRLACQPGSATVCLLGASGTFGVFKSTDAGLTWADSSTGLPNVRFDAFKFDLALPSTVYAVASNADGLYKSTDSGDTWTAADNGLPADLRDIEDLAIVRGAPNELFAVVELLDRNELLYASTDGGASWAVAHDFDPSGMRAVAASSTANAIGGGGGSGVVLVGTNRGSLRSSDGGSIFAEVNTGLIALFTVRVAARRLDPTNLYASSSSAGPFVSDDGGASWEERTTGLPGAGTYDWSLALSPVDEDEVLMAQDSELFRTVDAGANWSPTLADPTQFGDCGVFVETLAFSPSQPEELWAGNQGCFIDPDFTSPEILLSVDDAANWTPLLELPPGVSGDFSIPFGRIEVHPTDPNVVLEGAFFLPGDGGDPFFVVRRTADRGASWNDVLINPNAVGYLAMAPSDPTRIYAGSDGTEITGGITDVFRSDDTGETWTALNTGLECVATLAVDYEDPNTVYVGCFGLHVSTDGGLTWEDRGASGLPEPASIRWLEVIRLNGAKSLLAGTNTGVYTYPLNEVFADGFESGDTSAWSTTVP